MNRNKFAHDNRVGSSPYFPGKVKTELASRFAPLLSSKNPPEKYVDIPPTLGFLLGCKFYYINQFIHILSIPSTSFFSSPKRLHGWFLHEIYRITLVSSLLPRFLSLICVPVHGDTRRYPPNSCLLTSWLRALSQGPNRRPNLGPIGTNSDWMKFYTRGQNQVHCLFACLLVCLFACLFLVCCVIYPLVSSVLPSAHFETCALSRIRLRTLSRRRPNRSHRETSRKTRI